MGIKKAAGRRLLWIFDIAVEPRRRKAAPNHGRIKIGRSWSAFPLREDTPNH